MSSSEKGGFGAYFGTEQSSDELNDEEIVTEIDATKSVDDEESWIGGYTCEPEYTEAEMKALGIDLSEEHGSTSEDGDSSRLQNLNWCLCGHCVAMPSLIECSKCCRECVNLMENKLDEKTQCITEHERVRATDIEPAHTFCFAHNVSLIKEKL